MRFVHQAAATGIAKAVQLNVDQMKKTPIWISAAGRSKLGYMVLDADGHANIANADHSFPLTERFLLTLSGVVKCTTPYQPAGCEKTSAAGAPSLAPTFRPSSMSAYIRPLRYFPSGSHTNQYDLFHTVASDMEIQSAELLFIVSDNGEDYSHDIAFNQHVLGRLWAQICICVACMCCLCGGRISIQLGG